MTKPFVHIVDDNETALLLASDICAALGLEAKTWQNSANFLVAAENDFPADDIVILDVYMPENDGVDVLRALYAKNKFVKVILVSAKNRDTLTFSASLAQAFGHQLLASIQKPLSIDALRAVITPPMRGNDN